MESGVVSKELLKCLVKWEDDTVPSPGALFCYFTWKSKCETVLIVFLYSICT